MRQSGAFDEPSPFWDSADHEKQMDVWKARVAFDPACGSIQSVQRFNGPSGAELWAGLGKRPKANAALARRTRAVRRVIQR